MSVNLSGCQFRHMGLVDTVRDALEGSQVDPTKLHMEITESVIMENTEVATMLLEGLKSLGVEIHLDDFGTGFSSLSYLHRFPRLVEIVSDLTLLCRRHPVPTFLPLCRGICA